MTVGIAGPEILDKHPTASYGTFTPLPNDTYDRRALILGGMAAS